MVRYWKCNYTPSPSFPLGVEVPIISKTDVHTPITYHCTCDMIEQGILSEVCSFQIATI